MLHYEAELDASRGYNDKKFKMHIMEIAWVEVCITRH